MAVSTGCGGDDDPYLYPKYAEMYVGDTLSVRVMNWGKHMDADWDVPEELNIKKASVDEVVVVAKEATTDTVIILAFIGTCGTEHSYYRTCQVKIMPKEDIK